MPWLLLQLKSNHTLNSPLQASNRSFTPEMRPCCKFCFIRHITEAKDALSPHCNLSSSSSYSRYEDVSEPGINEKCSWGSTGALVTPAWQRRAQEETGPSSIFNNRVVGSVWKQAISKQQGLLPSISPSEHSALPHNRKREDVRYFQLLASFQIRSSSHLTTEKHQYCRFTAFYSYIHSVLCLTVWNTITGQRKCSHL